MATRNPIGSFLNATLTFVRGPLFLSILSVVLLALTIPAQATLLRGYLQDSSVPVAGEDVQSDSIALDAVGAEASGTRYLAQPAVEAVQKEATKLHRAMIADNSFPLTFAGMWKCVTVVVDSAVSSVPVGQRVESSVNFVQTNDGRVVARWEQPGWTEAQSSVVPLSQNEVSLERTNYFTQRGANQWAAHSRDRYLQLDQNRIAASSQVEQFIGGEFAGRYQTKSMLYRVSGNLAMR
jgi:hypothetical protein